MCSGGGQVYAVCVVVKERCATSHKFRMRHRPLGETEIAGQSESIETTFVLTDREREDLGVLLAASVQSQDQERILNKICE